MFMPFTCRVMKHRADLAKRSLSCLPIGEIAAARQREDRSSTAIMMRQGAKGRVTPTSHQLRDRRVMPRQSSWRGNGASALTLQSRTELSCEPADAGWLMDGEGGGGGLDHRSSSPSGQLTPFLHLPPSLRPHRLGPRRVELPHLRNRGRGEPPVLGLK
jgi:hypothetical protein